MTLKTVTGPVLKTPKKIAEKTRKQLLSLNALDKHRKTIRDSEFVYFPIIIEKIKNPPEGTEIISLETPVNSVLSVKEALKNAVPDELALYLPSSWDQIGNVIILEIKDEIKPFKQLIGQSLLESQPNIKAVYEKVSAVRGKTRTRKLELLAGEPINKVIHQEYGVKIVVDIHNTYFSPRLSLEHHLVSLTVDPGERVVDLFTGVGSFPLHIATRVPAEIFAIDINPAGIKCLEESIKLNKNKLKGQIHPIISDAKDWIKKQSQEFDRIIMNHPSQSYDFLKAALQILKPNGIIHFYSFEPIKTWSWETIKKINTIIVETGREINEVLNLRKVRQYSPDQYHVSCTLRIK